MKMHAILKLALVLVLGVPASLALAQARSNVYGTIDEVLLDDHVIVIDGERIVVREDELVITYKGEPIRPSLLDTGMSVMFSTRADGSLSEVTLVGPTDVLEELNTH